MSPWRRGRPLGKVTTVSEGATAVLVPIVLVVLGIIIALVMGKGK